MSRVSDIRHFFELTSVCIAWADGQNFGNGTVDERSSFYHDGLDPNKKETIFDVCDIVRNMVTLRGSEGDVTVRNIVNAFDDMNKRGDYSGMYKVLLGMTDPSTFEMSSLGDNLKFITLMGERFGEIAGKRLNPAGVDCTNDLSKDISNVKINMDVNRNNIYFDKEFGPIVSLDFDTIQLKKARPGSDITINVNGDIKDFVNDVCFKNNHKVSDYPAVNIDFTISGGQPLVRNSININFDQDFVKSSNVDFNLMMFDTGATCCQFELSGTGAGRIYFGGDIARPCKDCFISGLAGCDITVEGGGILRSVDVYDGFNFEELRNTPKKDLVAKMQSMRTDVPGMAVAEFEESVLEAE